MSDIESKSYSPDHSGFVRPEISNMTLSHDSALIRQLYRSVGIEGIMYYDIQPNGENKQATVTLCPEGTPFSRSIENYYAQVEYNGNGQLNRVTFGNRFDATPLPNMPILDVHTIKTPKERRWKEQVSKPEFPEPFHVVGIKNANIFSLYLQYPGTNKIKSIQANQFISFKRLAASATAALPGRNPIDESWRGIPELLGVQMESFEACYDVQTLLHHEFDNDTVISDSSHPHEPKTTPPILEEDVLIDLRPFAKA